MNVQLKKGILEMCVLHIIDQNKSMYGYTIMKEISLLFPDVNESSIYTILRRLYKSDFLEITLKDSIEGPQRKYYSLTKEGDQLLKEQKMEWKNLKTILDKLNIL